MQTRKTKTCKNHGILTEKDIRGGIYKGKKYWKCRQCELDRSRKYHTKMRTDNDWVVNKRKSDKDRWERKKPQIVAKRKTTEFLEQRRKWYEENITRERERYKIINQNQRKELSDNYVKKSIQNGDYKLKFNLIPNSLVELKRAIMLARRKIKLERSKASET